MTNRLKKLRTYATEFEAHEAKNVLVASGIKAFVENASSVTALSYIGPAIGGVKLMVEEADMERATEILDNSSPERIAAWTCSNCYSEVDEGFEVCWNCGGTQEASAPSAD